MLTRGGDETHEEEECDGTDERVGNLCSKLCKGKDFLRVHLRRALAGEDPASHDESRLDLTDDDCGNDRSGE